MRRSKTSLFKLPIEGGREATAGNTSAVRRLTTQWLYQIYFIGCFLVLRMGTVTK